MDTTLFKRYKSAISTLGEKLHDQRLLMEQAGDLSIYYAPLDWINPQARVVIVGITPGKTQMRNALVEARRQLELGANDECALRAAKELAAFSGPMRANLVALMDRVGLAAALRLDSCADLFGSARQMLQTASILPFPVFVGDDDYRGTPDPLGHPLLRKLVQEHFVPIVKQTSRAVFVPLGPVPTKVLQWLVTEGAVAADQVLHGLPHPSRANAERIKYFLGQKRRDELSAKTDPDRLDAARHALESRVRVMAT